jgi:hypothetical protein
MNQTQAPIKTVQDIQLDLIERASFNCFDGQQVKSDLLAHKDLWEGAIMGRFGDYELIPLRDIAYDIWNVDTLMILPKPGKEAELLSLASKWSADEMGMLEGLEIKRIYGGGEHKVLRLWWD